MSKESAIALGKLKAAFRRLPLPDKFSRLVSLLLDHVHRDTLICWPSRGRLAQLMGCSEKTVQRNLRAIRELGLFDLETVGADEMRRRVGNKLKVSERHTYTIYRLNSDHPLWTGEGLAHAKEVIKSATWRGVEERRQKQLPNTSQSHNGKLLAGTVPSLLKDAEEGRYRTQRRGTVPYLSNGDGTDSGSVSLLNNAVDSCVVS